MHLLRLGWKNLLHRPWSTALSLVLTALGAGLISILLVLNHQLQDQFDRNLAGIDLVLGAKGSPLQLILSSMYHVDAPTGNINIGEAKAFLRPGHPLIEQSVPLSLGDSYRGYRIVGTTPNILDLYEATLAEGRLWEKPLEVVIGANVASELQLALGATFQSSHGLLDDPDLLHEGAGSFVVTGVLAPSGSVVDQLILTANSSLWVVHDHEMGAPAPSVSDSVTHAAHDHAHDHDHDHDHTATTPLFDQPLHTYEDRDITAILLVFKGQNFQALNLGRNINENTNLQAATPAIEINRLYDNISAGERILQSLLYLIVAVSILSIFISLYTTLDDRRYELALMRVMGASSAELTGMILLEGILLAAAGCLLGLLLSHLGLVIFTEYLQEGYRYQFDPWLFLPEEGYLLAGAIIVGMTAALLPALRAGRTEISTTLAEG